MRLFTLSFVLLSKIVLAYSWDGLPSVDHSSFLSPITQSVKDNCRAILIDGQKKGRVEGRMAQIGDSMTHASPYFRAPVAALTSNETGHDYSAIRDWLSGDVATDWNSPWYRNYGKNTVWGNMSGWTVADAIRHGHPHAFMNRANPDQSDGDSSKVAKLPDTVGNFSWAVVMFGSNDIRKGHWKQSTWKSEYKAFIEDVIAEGCIPVLSTIPPLNDGSDCSTAVENPNIALANQAIVQIARELRIPYIDYHGAILNHQPDNWCGGLISRDGVHPSNGGDGGKRSHHFTIANITADNGYALRSKLTLDMAEKVKEIIFDNSPADDI